MIDSISSINGQNGVFASEAADPNRVLGRDDFLNLLIQQIKHQDPLDPLKNEEFVAQMAQFSSLEQLINLNDAMTQMRLLEASINNSQAVNLIGKDITVFGNALQIQDGSANAVNFDLAEEAAQVTVSIYNSAGAVVRTLTLGAQSAGKHDISFDGKDDQGIQLADGDYTFEISATDGDGNAIQSTSYSNIHVEGLTFDNGIVYLIAGGGKFLMSDIVEVREP